MKKSEQMYIRPDLFIKRMGWSDIRNFSYQHSVQNEFSVNVVQRLKVVQSLRCSKPLTPALPEGPVAREPRTSNMEHPTWNRFLYRTM